MYISLIYCWISSFSTSKQFFSLKSKFFTKLYQQKSSITKTSSNVIDSPRIYSYQSFILSSEDRYVNIFYCNIHIFNEMFLFIVRKQFLLEKINKISLTQLKYGEIIKIMMIYN